MTFAFDLISDLHTETWDDFTWTGLATSPYCVVAGDVARDRTLVLEVLRHLGQCYQAVFYIDGNDEHRYFYDDLNASYSDLTNRIKKIPNVVFLQDNVVVVDGVAIVGTNGWWSYDLDPSIDAEQTSLWFQEQCQVSAQTAKITGRLATTDATYMATSIKRLQTHHDVKKIVCVTHTVPNGSLISHDIGLADTLRFNTMGNGFMMRALAADTEKKLHTWCFGHYHGSVDQIRQGVRFVNNCRGRGDTEWRQYVYHPRRIVVDDN
jgi:predicted phosphohydrolase